MFLEFMKSKWASFDLSDKAYFCGGISSLAGMLLHLTGAYKVSYFFYLLAYCIIAFGFCRRFMPELTKRYNNKAFQVASTIAHLFILIASAALARELISYALRLPIQDFQLTTNFFTLLLYIPVWTTFAATIFVVYSIFMLLLWVVVSVTNEPLIDYALNVAANLFTEFKISKYLSTDHRDKLFWNGIFDAAGAIVIAITLCAPIWLYSMYQENLYPAVKLIAYLTDYKTAASYPYTSENERIILHQNGLISSAKMSNSTIIIGTRMFPNNSQ